MSRYRRLDELVQGASNLFIISQDSYRSVKFPGRTSVLTFRSEAQSGDDMAGFLNAYSKVFKQVLFLQFV